MGAKISKSTTSVKGNYDIPLYDFPLYQDIISNHNKNLIADCEKDIARLKEEKKELEMRLCSALVHTREKKDHVKSGIATDHTREIKDVKRGIVMLQALLESDRSFRTEEKLYLLAIGYYRLGEFSKSLRLVEQTLMIAPAFHKPVHLKEILQARFAKEAKIGSQNQNGSDYDIPMLDDKSVIASYEADIARLSKVWYREEKKELEMHLSFALVHSRETKDVRRGITMLEALLESDVSFATEEKLYLLAVGYYRSNEFSKSLQLVEQSLEIAPTFYQPLYLKVILCSKKKKVLRADQFAKGGVIRIGLVVVALVAVTTLKCKK